MTPRLCDDISEIWRRTADCVRLFHRPVTRREERIARLACRILMRDGRLVGGRWCMAQAERWARRGRALALRIDAATPKPTTTGDVAGRLGSDAQLARHEQQRVRGEAGRTLRQITGDT